MPGRLDGLAGRHFFGHLERATPKDRGLRHHPHPVVPPQPLAQPGAHAPRNVRMYRAGGSNTPSHRGCAHASKILTRIRSQEEIFFQVFERGVERQLEAFTGAFAPSPKLDDVAKAADTWRNVLAHDEEWLAFNLEFRLYALRNPRVRARFADEQRKTRTMIARYIEAQTQSFGLALKLPAETLAAILDATSVGFLEDALITSDDAHPYEDFLRLIVPSIVDLPTDVSATSSASPE